MFQGVSEEFQERSIEFVEVEKAFQMILVVSTAFHDVSGAFRCFSKFSRSVVGVSVTFRRALESFRGIKWCFKGAPGGFRDCGGVPRDFSVSGKRIQGRSGHVLGTSGSFMSAYGVLGTLH